MLNSIPLHDAVAWMQSRGMLSASPLRDHVAAVSCGLHGGQAVLDLGAAPGGFLQILAEVVGELLVDDVGIAPGHVRDPARDAGQERRG